MHFPQKNTELKYPKCVLCHFETKSLIKSDASAARSDLARRGHDMFAILGDGEPDTSRFRQLEPFERLPVTMMPGGVSQSVPDIRTLTQRATSLDPLPVPAALRGSYDKLQKPAVGGNQAVKGFARGGRVVFPAEDTSPERQWQGKASGWQQSPGPGAVVPHTVIPGFMVNPVRLVL